MEHVTSNGVRVKVGRVPRQLLDNINLPEPAPPTRAVETWGGIAERVPVFDDPDYRRQLSDWRLGLFAQHWNIISAAIEVDAANTAEATALQAAGFGQGRAVDALHYTLAGQDQVAIIAKVFYQSTVTERAILEAEARFAYTWRGKPLSAWSMRYAPGERGQLAVHWRAAFRSRMTWTQFCVLSGQEQSANVAFWSLEDRMNYLLQNYANNTI